MPTNIPDGAGALSQVVSGIANAVDGSTAGQIGAPADQMAGEIVRKIALGVERTLKDALGSVHGPWAMDRGVARPPISASDSEVAALSAEIPALKSRIESMRSEAVRLLSSDNPIDRSRGRNELEVAVELFSLLCRMLEQQLQILAQEARSGVR